MPKPVQGIAAPEALRNEFGIVGGLPGMSVDEVIVPVAVVANLGKPEERTTEVRIWGIDQQLAVVGELSEVGLWNPAGSGKLVQVEQVTITSPDAGNVAIRVFDHAAAVAAGFTFSAMHNRDRRVDGLNFDSPAPSAVMGTDTAVAQPGTNVWLAGIQADDALVIKIEAILTPGTGIIVTRALVNSKLTACFLGSERPLTVSGN